MALPLLDGQILNGGFEDHDPQVAEFGILSYLPAFTTCQTCSPGETTIHMYQQPNYPPSEPSISEVSLPDSHQSSWNENRLYGEESLSDVEDERWNRSQTSQTQISSRQLVRSRSLAPVALTSSNANHGRSSVQQCRDCGDAFTKVFELEEHAKNEGHKPFGCDSCDKRFSRRDAQRRHLDLHFPKGRHACPYCPKYQGSQAFTRKDHLRRHLRNVHQQVEPSCTRNSPKLPCVKHCVSKGKAQPRTQNLKDGIERSMNCTFLDALDALVLLDGQIDVEQLSIQR